jgi:hypothetical protein
MPATIDGLHEPGTRAPMLILNKVLDEGLSICSYENCPDSLCLASFAGIGRTEWNAELVNELKRY